MKKGILILFVLALSSFASLFAYDCEVDGIYYNRLSADELEVTYKNLSSSYMGDVIVPKTVTYRDKVFKVTQISSFAFQGCKELTSVSLPEGIKVLPNYSFSGCSSLTSISIPATVSSIGEGVFGGCSSLIDIVLPENVTTIGSYTFQNCQALQTINIPESVTAIGSYAFQNCQALQIIIIPEGVTTISKYMFSGCSNLTSISLPESLSKIESFAFENCKSLNAINLPQGLNTFGTNLFENCASLTSITLPDHFIITERSFAGCKNLTSIISSGGLKSVGDYAFRGCTSLTDIVCISAGEGAFSGCSGLQSITIPNGDRSGGFGKNAFYGCTGLKKVIIKDISNWCKTWFGSPESNPLYYAQHLFSDEDTEIKDLYIGRDIYDINDYVFYKAEYINNIHILQDTPPTIKENTFGNTCYTWTDVFVPAETKEQYQNADYWKNFKSISEIDYTTEYDGVMYRVLSESEAETIANKDRYSGDVVIADSVTISGKEYRVIAVGGFARSANLTSVTIPNSVTTIKDFAFAYCNALSSISIPNSVTIIESEAFMNCSALTSVSLGNNLTIIGQRAFENCTGLTSITIPNSVTTIGGGAFRNCSGIASITFPNSLRMISSQAFSNCSGLKSLSLPNGITTLESRAFENCTGLTSIYIPSSVNNIGGSGYINGNAFIGCSGLESIIVSDESTTFDSRDNCNAIIETATNTFIVGCKNSFIPENVTTIANYAYSNCELTAIYIPSSVKSIGTYVFDYCSGLKSIVVSDDNTVYDSRDNCNAIIETATNTLIFGCQKTIIPNAITTIKSYAFFGHSTLTSISIPNTITTIGQNAFYKCGLSSITIPNSVNTISDFAFYCCDNLSSIVLGEGLKSLGWSSFDSPNIKTITLLGTVPPQVHSLGAFRNYYATLCVPTGTKDAYQNADEWNKFWNIIEFDPSGIQNITFGKNANLPVYDLNGRRLTEPQKGINIIGGKKVFVK
jgi:hypothetical protein